MRISLTLFLCFLAFYGSISFFKTKHGVTKEQIENISAAGCINAELLANGELVCVKVRGVNGTQLLERINDARGNNTINRT